MPGSDDTWRPRRILAFLAFGAIIYSALFLWSDATLRQHGRQNPFLRIATAPERVDWIILGASHALPLGFADMPEVLRDRTGQGTLTLAVTGGGPFLMRVIAERWFADHQTRGVLIVLDSFAFADRRWNEDRLADSDVLPKIPADRVTVATLWAAVPRGLAWQTWVAYVSGFARINDRTRFAPDSWEAEAKFDTAPRPNAAATKARIAFLYPGPPDPAAMGRGLQDLQALIQLAQARGARVVIVRPPLPEPFRQALPALPEFEARFAALAADHAVPVHDFSTALPETRNFFDADHLNRTGVLRWLEAGLADLLRADDSGQ
ncbi:SGNH/GDSL hydrolase family protein [Paracoccus sp. FO-3]|uniref:SGNH/GDSL hydrolase family protein n=1 Tax=Paracoccus sp. FO-3 TaxID=1335059 RepID=UPI00112A1031|nr:SGNH/GDSL hydrolase family protein [Paracoccus sp. FO-3]